MPSEAGNRSAQSTRVGLATPELIQLRRGALTQLRRVLIAALPDEGCALLLGDCGPASTLAGAVAWGVEQIWPCCNVWMPPAERLHRFAIDPREQLLAQRWARQRGLTMLGSAHSHPQGQPVPSATDLALAFTPALQLILSPAAGWLPQAWWLEGTPDGAATASPLPWCLGV